MNETFPARTVAGIISAMAQSHGTSAAIVHRGSGSWDSVSYHDFSSIVSEVGRGLLGLGLQPGDRVCILSDTRPEWTYVDYAIVCAGGVVVPIYPSSTAEECAWVVSDSGARMVICENAAQLSKIDSIRDRLPELQTVVVIDPVEASGARSLEMIRSAGRAASTDELLRRSAAVEPEDPWSIVYTSGTTGPPKGCVLTHGGMTSVCDGVRELGVFAADERSYLFLPLAHMFARIIALMSADVGATVIYFSGDTSAIVDELAETKPTFLPSVPRIFEKIYIKATAAAADSSAPKRAIFNWAVGVGRRVARLTEEGRQPSGFLAIQHNVADRLVFSKVRGLLGGQVRNALTGAAPIAPEILEFFYGAGIPVLEGYGMTESTAAIAITPPGRPRFGTVGTALPGVEIRIAEDGEILARGKNVFAGYFGNPEATAETVIDGWLHTGDLGALDADGYLTITGRKKDIIITAGGKNLSPANVENDLQCSRWISRALMHGDRRPYPVALITLDPDEISAYAAANDLPATLTELAAHPRIRELIQGEVDTVNERHAKVAQIKKFAILDRDFSQESGELTPTLKIRRAVIEKAHTTVLDGLYS